jgi:hypothetical protein
MSSRLPVPGADGNNWGSVLNDYLQQTLNSNGTLITTNTNSYTGLTNANLSSSSQPGLVQLSSDLGGSAASPSVVAIRGQAISSTAPTNGYVLTWSSSSSNWSAQAPVTGGGSGGSGGGGSGGSGYTGDLDGGASNTIYGGTTSIDGGDST